MMETEFKYRLMEEGIFNHIVEDRNDKGYGSDGVEVIEMMADYFDTEDLDLRNKGIAYRVRREDDRLIATIKWDLDVEVNQGLTRREEINLVINDERFAENPNIELFISSDAYDVLYNATQGKKLHKVVDMEFTRRQIRVDTGKSISCISEDRGCIHHISGTTIPIYELEIEWYHGDEDDFMNLASEVQEKYGLEFDNSSKLQKAFL